MLPLLLGLGSALALAAANACVKGAKDVLAARSVLSLTCAAIVAPGLLFAPAPNLAMLGVLAISVPVHWFYQAAMIRALSRGDLSRVFPIMRGSAPLFTAFAAAVFLHEALSVTAIVGLLIAAAATVVFALPERALAGSGGFRDGAYAWALATGLGVALYNVVDAWGVRVAPSWITFTVWLFLLDWIGVNATTFWSRRGRYLHSLKAAVVPGAAAGALSVISFGLALWGFSIAPVALISATRETAIVFAALMGWLFLGEGLGVRRFFSALVLAGGLALLHAG